MTEPLTRLSDSGLLAALRTGAPGPNADIWECRVCARTTCLVVVVPYDGAWRHQVHPLCAEHYPDPEVRWTDGWPGPATPTRGARRRRASEALDEALRNVESAARRVTALLDGTGPGEWKFAGKRISDEIADPLLSLHDYLNDIERARGGLDSWR